MMNFMERLFFPQSTPLKADELIFVTHKVTKMN